MTASPINPSDLIPVWGAYSARTKLPFVPGFEGVGIIEEVHPGSERSLVGHRVIPIGSAGGWQSVKHCHLDWCVPVPDNISDVEAATAYINPLTAIRMVELHANTDGIHTAVVNAAGSAIARTLGHLLTQRGIRAIGLRRAPSRDDLDNCWTAVIDTSGSGWREKLRRLTRTSGIGLAFDCVGGNEGAELAQALNHGGTFVHYGLLSGRPLPFSLQQERPDLTIDLFRLRDWVHRAEKQQVTEKFSRAFDLIRRGIVKTRVQDEVPLENVATGIEISLNHASRGKIILRP